MTRRGRAGYNHGAPAGYRPPAGQWWHGDEIDRARQAASRRTPVSAASHRSRWAPAAGRVAGRWMLSAFCLLAGWIAVVAVVRIGVASLGGPPPGRGMVRRAAELMVHAHAILAVAAVAGAPLAAWQYARRRRERDPAGLAPAELAAAWAAPGLLAVAAYRTGTGRDEAWLLMAWALWWAGWWGWVRLVRPPERRAASYARTRARAARRGRQAAVLPRPVLAAARRCWSAAVAGAAWVARAPEDRVPDLDPGDEDEGERRWTPAQPRREWVRPSEREPAPRTRGNGHNGTATRADRREAGSSPSPAPAPEPAAAPDPVADLAARLRVDPAGLKAVAGLLAPGKVTTSGEAAAVTGMARRTVARYLKALADDGLAVRVGDGRGGPGSGFRAATPPR